MTIRDVLLRLDSATGGDAWRDRIVEIAKRRNAHLTGLFVLQAPDLPSFATVEIPLDMVHNYEAAERDAAAKLKWKFLASTEAAAVSAEWREAIDRGEGDPTETQGRYTDLVAVGMPGDPALAKDAVGTIGRLSLNVGGPLLIVPTANAPATIGSQVVVAWNGSREASRALRDAMPLLSEAGRVIVFSINSPENEHIPGADICTHLARHGVKAEAKHTVAHHVETGQA